jgi:hypothetical protein
MENRNFNKHILSFFFLWNVNVKSECWWWRLYLEFRRMMTIFELKPHFSRIFENLRLRFLCRILKKLSSNHIHIISISTFSLCVAFLSILYHFILLKNKLTIYLKFSFNAFLNWKFNSHSILVFYYHFFF